MALDINSKHGIILGFLTTAITLPNIVYMAPEIIIDLSSNAEESFYIIDYWYVAFYLLASISGCLLIFGIIKNRRTLLVPWLAAEILFTILYVKSPLLPFYGYQLILILIGFQALLLYPICNLFFEIGRKNAAIKAIQN